MTTRQEKVNSLIQREIAEYLRDEELEGITGLVTITGVEVTPDLELAKVYFSVVGQDENGVWEILKKNFYEIQGKLYNKLVMRKVPRIAFILDESGKHADRIAKLIHKLHEDGNS